LLVVLVAEVTDVLEATELDCLDVDRVKEFAISSSPLSESDLIGNLHYDADCCASGDLVGLEEGSDSRLGRNSNACARGGRGTHHSKLAALFAGNRDDLDLKSGSLVNSCPPVFAHKRNFFFAFIRLGLNLPDSEASVEFTEVLVQHIDTLELVFRLFPCETVRGVLQFA